MPCTETENDLLELEIELEIIFVVHNILEQQLYSELSVLKEDISCLKFHIKRTQKADVIFAYSIRSICLIYPGKQGIQLSRVASYPKNLI